MNNTMGSPFGGTLTLKTINISGVASTGATTFSAAAIGTGAYLEWAIRGKAYSHAALSGAASPTTDTNTGAAFVKLAANKGGVFVLAFDASGNVKGFQGPVVAVDDAGVFQSAPEFPVIGDTYAPFCYIVVKTDSTNTAGWTFGSDNWNATGVTSAAVSVVMLPDRPQVS